MRVAEILQQFALFADLTPPQVEAIAQSHEERVFATGDRVLRRGLSSGDFYVILEGEAVVGLGEEDGVRLGRGGVFGGVSSLIGGPPAAGVVAASPLRRLVSPAPPL